MNQGRDAHREQIGADQESDLVLGQVQCRADDERDRDGPGIHDEDMLQGDGEHLPWRKHGVHRVDCWVDLGRIADPPCSARLSCRLIRHMTFLSHGELLFSRRGFLLFRVRNKC